MPHATIGVGVFMAASLVAASTLPRCPWHEYQPSVFDANLRHVDTTMACAAGHYALPSGPGVGAKPRDSLWDYRIDA
jgi:galactonate dehydratase